MCNRYEIRGSVSQIRALAKKLGRELFTTPATDNLAEIPNVYPDKDAPILVNRPDGGLELRMTRWGFPPAKGRSEYITNIRNLESRWWRDVNRQFLVESAYRCLVPFTAFAEPVRDSTWFVVPNEDVTVFAGIWRPWRGERLAEQPGAKRRVRVDQAWELYAFLTTDPNDHVRPVHPNAMPVILTTADEQSEWLAGGVESLRLQRSLPNDLLAVRKLPQPVEPE